MDATFMLLDVFAVEVTVVVVAFVAGMEVDEVGVVCSLVELVP